MCVVVPMKVTHILLGRPWQFDRKLTHNGVTNRYSFEHIGYMVVLKSLFSKEVCEDQIKIKKEKAKRARDKKERKRKRKTRVIEKRNRQAMKQLGNGMQEEDTNVETEGISANRRRLGQLKASRPNEVFPTKRVPLLADFVSSSRLCLRMSTPSPQADFRCRSHPVYLDPS
ncbi:hypothetical protein CR513_46622, partial [Mucuna pruriens]